MHEGRLTEKTMPRKNKAVIQAERVANELHNQMYGKTSEEAPIEEKKTEAVEEKVESVASATTEAPTQEQVEAPQEVEVEQKNEVIPQPSNDFEHKYKVLQNKYSAEVPRLASELRSLKEELTTLRSENESLKSVPVEQQTESKQLITDSDREQYGDELLDVMKRVSQEVMSKSVAPSQNVAKLEKDVTTTQQELLAMKEQRFRNELISYCPNWETINTDKGFLDWLGELDDLTGQTRQSMLEDAHQSYDSWRVANFFNKYLEGQTQAEPSSNKPSLETQVTPKPSGKSKSPSGKTYYTTQEVAKFYADCRSGKYKNKAERDRIENDIFKAMADNRIRTAQP